MNDFDTSSRRRSLRRGASRRVQGGTALRGAVVAAGLVAAVALQLLGPQLQDRLVGAMGMTGFSAGASASAANPPASMSSHGTPAVASTTRPCKVAAAISGRVPVI